MTSGSSGTPGVPDVVLTSQYDLNGNRTALTAGITPLGGSTSTADFQNSYSFDRLNRETFITQQGIDGGNAVAAKNVTLGYDAGSRLTGLGFYDGSTPLVSGAYGYDHANRLTGLSWTGSGGPFGSYGGVYDQFAWSYDNNSRVSAYSNPDNSGENLGYSYDNNGQLTSADGYGGSGDTYNINGFSWDANGNPTERSIPDGYGGTYSSGDFVTGPGNRLLTDGTYNYTYDKSGHMTKQAAGSYEIDYAWDNRGHLTPVTNKTSGTPLQIVANTYDMFNDLIGRVLTTYSGGSTTTSTTRFVYDGGNAVLAFDGTGAMTDRYLWGPAVDELLADERFAPTTSGEMPTSSGTNIWALTDSENSVRDLVTSAGLQNHLVYDSFGQIVSETGSLDVAFRHNGTFYDPATGMEYHNDPASGYPGRWYNPALQRWISVDPTGLTFGPNPYVYCGNSPTNFVDPSGLTTSSHNKEGEPNVTSFVNDNMMITTGYWLIVASSADPDDVAAGLGHSWIAVVNKQEIKAPRIDKEITSRGFSPVDGSTPTDTNPCGGLLRHEDKTRFKHAIARSITRQQYVSIKAFLGKEESRIDADAKGGSPKAYQIRNRNCTSFVNGVLQGNSMGLAIPPDQRSIVPGVGTLFTPSSLSGAMISPSLPVPWFQYDTKFNIDPEAKKMRDEAQKQ